MAILKIIVTISIFIVFITYLFRQWIENTWFSNKWKTIIGGFLLGAIIGIVIYYLERVWIKIHISKPFNLMPFYLLPYWQYNRYRNKITRFLKQQFKKNKGSGKVSGKLDFSKGR